MKIFSTLLSLLCVTSFVSCQKDPEPLPTQSKTDLITASVWVHESSGVDGDKNGTIDLPLLTLGVPQCQLDNTLLFKKDNTAVADEGATKCNASAPQTNNFNWNFADNESSIVISNNVFPSLNGKFTVSELTTTKMTIKKDTSMPAPIGNVSIIVNLKH